MTRYFSLIILSLLICWSYERLYNERKEYDNLLKNVMNRLERFENDEVLHKRHSQRSVEENLYGQRDYKYYNNINSKKRLIDMLTNQALMNKKRSKIYHNNQRKIYHDNHANGYFVNEDDDDYDQNLVDEGDDDKDENLENESAGDNAHITQSIQMPNVAPQERDTYLCFAHKLPEQDNYIVEFHPLAEQQIAHHMLLFGCKLPYNNTVAWQCREMAPICMGQQQIMYAWAKNAPSLVMPNDVGFHVGGDSGVEYLVLQVHYLHVDSFKNGHTDTSGLTFTMTPERPQYFAGIYLLADGWTDIPPHKTNAHIDMACDFTSDNLLTPTIYPFRFRVHAHKLGVVNTGYRVRNGKWTLIGRGDPQRPQAFNTVFNDVDIKNGDKLFGRCTYDSTGKDTVTHIGATHSDEMCNFYIMYFYKRPTSAEEAAAANNLPCSSVKSFQNYEWPEDSDTPLAEMEERNRQMLEDDSDLPPIYQVNTLWPHLNEEAGKTLHISGQISGVAYDDDKGHLYIFQREDRVWDGNTFDHNNHIKSKTLIDKPTIVKFNDKGEVIKAGGENMFSMPHGITVDKNGNVWVTDVGLHQVFKLSDKLEVMLTVGHEFISGSEPGYFCKPTDVAVMEDGSFFVSDGYCNSRVIKYDSHGQILLIIDNQAVQSLHTKHMTVVHSLALDEAEKKLYVADRENGRILIFNAENGILQNEVPKGTFHGAVYAIAYAIIPHYGEVLHVVNGPIGAGTTSISGFTYSIGEEKVISKWEPEHGFHRPHDIAATKDSQHVFISEIGPNRIWKFDRVTLPTQYKRERP